MLNAGIPVWLNEQIKFMASFQILRAHFLGRNVFVAVEQSHREALQLQRNGDFFCQPSLQSAEFFYLE